MGNMDNVSNGEHKLLWVILAIKKEINAKPMQIPRLATISKCGLFKSNQRHQEDLWRHQVWTLGWDVDKKMLNPLEWSLWQFLLNRAVQSGEFFARPFVLFIGQVMKWIFFVGGIFPFAQRWFVRGPFKSRAKISCASKCLIFSSLSLPPPPIIIRSVVFV